VLISLNWLKDFVEIREAPAALAERLTMAGLEVEGVSDLSEGFENVVIGQIVSLEPHADAQRLTVCQVDVGQDTRQIVCGASNQRRYDKVVVALPGAVLAGAGTIGKSKIRGAVSHGMICSESEIGLSDEADGVMILPEDAPVGASAAEYLGRRDTVLEIDLTPNRADCLSHLGVAREVVALTGCSFQGPPAALEEAGPEVSTLSEVRVHDPQLCPRYAARMVLDVSVGPSPAWLQQRLRAVGLRPINNVVDVTNYVLMEMGHPLHAFDYDLLAQNRIEVRRAASGERLRTLDGVERDLDPSVLLICDGEKPVALAGIMGGANTQVYTATTRVFLEAAYFQPASIRRTAKKLGLHSDSSHRFERGTDIEGLIEAIDRAAVLIQQVAGGTIARGRIDVYPEQWAGRELRLRTGQVSSLLGLKLATDEIADILSRLGLDVRERDAEGCVVHIPPFRVDLEREVDLIEEVARIYGYNRIPSTIPTASIVSGQPTRRQRLTARLREILVSLGYTETIHYSFHNPQDLEWLGLPETDPRRSQIRIRNPLSEEQSVLRTTLLPGLLHAARRNQSLSLTNLRIFEMGRVFEKKDSGLPREHTWVAGLMVGQDVGEGWNVSSRTQDFFDMKGDLEELFERLQVGRCDWGRSERLPFLHPGKSTKIACDGVSVGYAGELHPSAVKRYDLAEQPLCFELDLDRLVEKASETIVYTPPIRFPSVERDLALVLSDKVPAGEVAEQIRNIEPELIRDVRLFDLYLGTPIPNGQKSLAFAVRFQAPDRTLKNEEINEIRDKIVTELHRTLGATLRD
jgi:phenylalanyl-tRNA synthetase beta chain